MPKGRINYEIDFSERNETLSDVFGDKPINPVDMTKKIWVFIKKYNLGRKTE
jgi:hypothetical protein